MAHLRHPHSDYPQQVAVVTGCARAPGIGRACVRNLLSTGQYRVIGIDICEIESLGFADGTCGAGHTTANNGSTSENNSATSDSNDPLNSNTAIEVGELELDTCLFFFGQASVADPHAISRVLDRGMTRFFGSAHTAADGQGVISQEEQRQRREIMFPGGGMPVRPGSSSTGTNSGPNSGHGSRNGSRSPSPYPPGAGGPYNSGGQHGNALGLPGHISDVNQTTVTVDGRGSPGLPVVSVQSTNQAVIDHHLSLSNGKVKSGPKLGAITVLVNCAGNAQPYMMSGEIVTNEKQIKNSDLPSVESRLREFDSYLDGHLRGAFVMTESCRGYFPLGDYTSHGLSDVSKFN